MDVCIATCKDCEENELWVTPFAEACTGRVPSVFFIADTLLELDEMFKGMLLQTAAPRLTKPEVALWEASKIKRLSGHSRQLWRATTQSRYEAVQRIKDAITASTPTKSACSSNLLTDQEAAWLQDGGPADED